MRHSEFPKSILGSVGLRKLARHFTIDGGDYSYYKLDVKQKLQ